MGLTADEVNKIKKIGITFTFILVSLIAILWLIQYSRAKKLAHEFQINESGQISAHDKKILPFDLEAHEQVALRYCVTDQPAKAIPHLKRCLAFKPGDRFLRFKLAMANLDAGNFDQALKDLNRLEDNEIKDTLTSRICAQKGIALFYVGRLEESETQLKSCLSENPRSAESACFLGQIAASRSEATAREYLDRALNIDSLYVEGWYQRARFSMQQGKYLEARKMLMRALEIDPLHVKSHSRLGMVYYYLHDYQLAKKSYLTALALNPRDFNTRYNLGELYYTVQADPENALREFKMALSLNPGHVEANFKVGLICLNNNMIKESIRYFETARANEPENIRVLLQLAVAYEKLGDKPAALRCYQAIIEVDALNGVARQKIAYLSNDLNDHVQNQ